MASDSQLTSGNTKTGKYKKIHRLKSGALLGQSGAGDIRATIKLLDPIDTEAKLPTAKQIADLRTDLNCILVLPNGKIFNIDAGKYEGLDAWWGSIVPATEKIAVGGSGGDFALAAMKSGLSAKEAVEIAIKCDIYSGPPVKTLAL